MADQANLATAKINLGYTDIVAPITGKVGRTNITKGNVVSPESGHLTDTTTAKPYPPSPVRAASIVALSASRSGWRYHGSAQ